MRRTMWQTPEIADIVWSVAVTHLSTAIEHEQSDTQGQRAFSRGFLTALLSISVALNAAPTVYEADPPVQLADRIRGLIQAARRESDSV